MKLTCPNCHETLSLAALIEHDAAREAVRAALEFPAPLGKQLMQYVSLFKPAQRALSMDRFASILGELTPLIQAAQIERNGRLWSAPHLYWQQAFESMWLGRDKLTLPLKSHGYLFEVIVGYANKAEAKQETKAEQGRIYGRDDHVAEVGKVIDTSVCPQGACPTSLDAKASSQSPKPKRSEMPDEVRKTLHKLTGKKHGD